MVYVLHLVSLHSIMHTSHMFGGMRFRVSNLSVTIYGVVLESKTPFWAPNAPNMAHKEAISNLDRDISSSFRHQKYLVYHEGDVVCIAISSMAC